MWNDLEWPDVHLEPGQNGKFGYVQVKRGKSKNAVRAIPLTPRASEMLTRRRIGAKTAWIFPNEAGEAPWLGTSLNHQHQKVRQLLKLPKDFVCIPYDTRC